MILLLLASACTPDALDAPNARVHTVIDDTAAPEDTASDTAADSDTGSGDGGDDSGDTALEDTADTGSASTDDTSGDSDDSGDNSGDSDDSGDDSGDTAIEDTAAEPCDGIEVTPVSCTGSCTISGGAFSITTSAASYETSSYETSSVTFTVIGCTTGASGRSLTQTTAYGWHDLSWPGDSNPSTTAGKSTESIRNDPTVNALLDDYGNPVDGPVDTEVTLNILTWAKPEFGGANANIATDHGWVSTPYSVN